MTSETVANGVGGLPLYASGLTLAELDLKGGKGFWTEVERFTGESDLASHIDAAMSGKASPRVWTIHAAPGQNGLAAAAALVCARALAARGQATIVLDGDDHHPDLTRWSGRFELEGWIDLVRYGASLTTSSAPLEFEGKKSVLVGVGSFWPTQVEDQEIKALLDRLRRQADDIIVVVPSGEAGRSWADLAQIRLLCWDQLSLSPEGAEELIAENRTAGYEMTGLIGFGVAESEAVERKIRPEVTAADEVAEEVAEDAADEIADEAAADAAIDDDPAAAEAVTEVRTTEEDVVEDWSPTDEEATPAVAEEGPSSAVADTDLGGEAADDEADEWSREDRGRRTSGVFWGVAAAFLICIVAAGGYYLKFVRGPQQRPGEPMVPVAMQATNQSQEHVVDQEDPYGSGQDAEAGTGEAVVAEAGMADMNPGIPAGADDDLSGDDPLETAVETAQPAGPGGGDPTPELPEPTADAGDTPPEPAVVDQGFDPAPYQVPVGEAGWAFHLFSFPDDRSAQDEARRLEARGLNAEVRPVDLSGKGRWYRVYAGSFSSRAAANAVRGDLLVKLGTDWANPVRYGQ